MDSLLNEIMQAAMCPYLFDLHSDEIVFDESVRERIMQIPSDHYPLEHWCKAAVYITNTDCTVHSAQEAKEIICMRLLKKQDESTSLVKYQN